MLKIFKRLFCKHDFEIIRNIYGLYVYNYIKRCKICGKEKVCDYDDIESALKQGIILSKVKVDRSKMCKLAKELMEWDKK